MRRALIAGGLGMAVAFTAVAAQAQSGCEAYAHNRRVTGTVVGALGGGLLGAAVAGHGSKGTGALVGAGLGAVVGNNVSRVSCDRRYSSRSYRRHYARASYRATPYYGAPTGEAADTAYRAGGCHYETRPYYNQAGQLVYAPTQVCQ